MANTILPDFSHSVKLFLSLKVHFKMALTPVRLKKFDLVIPTTTSTSQNNTLTNVHLFIDQAKTLFSMYVTYTIYAKHPSIVLLIYLYTVVHKETAKTTE